jgi:AAHS family 4-hydroxybenzoate transporter-like MFS transporter
MKVNVAEVIDRSPIGGFQIRVIILCALVALMDGFDIQAMALVTPRVAAEWGLQRGDFGPIISASFVGIMFGAMAGGVLGDRLGRRLTLIAAFAFVGLTSLATAFADNTQHLLIMRLLTGFGIGACMPNFTALTAEYVPAKKVAFMVSLMYSAVPLGGVLGGYIAPVVMDQFGWRGVFVAGGVIPLAIIGLLFIGLPESLRFLIAKGVDKAKAAMILGRIDPAGGYTAASEFVVPAKPPRSSLSELFSDGRAGLTIGIWVVFFFSLFGMYMLVSWLPSVFTDRGWPPAKALQSAAMFQLGGIFGGLLIGWFIDRMGPFLVLAASFALAAFFTAAIGSYVGTMGVTMVIIAFAGAAVVGAQLGMTSLAAGVYPTHARATGVGWGLGVGRLGAVISPTVGGLALNAGWSQSSLFLGAAAPAALCTLATLALWLTRRNQTLG